MLDEVVRVARRVDGADVALAALLVQADVLADEDADADAAEVEAIQKGVDFRELRERERLVLDARLELDDSAAWGYVSGLLS